MVHLSEQRQAQLTDYAQRHGQEPEAALDAIIADALEGEHRDYLAAVDAIKRGYEDLSEGRTRPLDQSFATLRQKHGLSS